MAFLKRNRELPEDLQTLHTQAIEYLMAEKYDDAVTQYEKITEKFPKNGAIWLEYTHALLGIGKRDDAKKAYEMAKRQTKIDDSILNIGNSHTKMEFGILLEEEGKSKLAEMLYRSAIARSKEWYRPWFLLAGIYKKKEDYKKAEEIFQEALQSVNDERARILLGLAEVLTLQNRFEEGLEVRREATKVNPNFAEAWFAFAVDSYQFGDYDEAEQALAKARDLSKEDPALMDSITQTVKMLEDRLKKCPEGMDEGEFMFSVGVVYYQNQDFERTRKAMERAVRLRPKHAKSWTVLGGALTQLRELKEAEKACKIAISLDSKSVAAYQVLSSIRALKGNMQAAIDVLNEGIAANPEDLTLRKLLADAEKVRGGDQIQSKELSEADQNKIEAMKLLAEGKLDKALNLFKKAVKLNPDDADAWAQLGLIYVNLKKFDDGEKAARKAIDLEKDNAVAWGVLGAALGDAGKLEEAETALSKAVELDPTNASNILPLGFIHMQLGNLDMAQTMLEKAVRLRPKVPVAWQMLSQIYKLQGKESEAANALANAQRYGLR